MSKMDNIGLERKVEELVDRRKGQKISMIILGLASAAGYLTWMHSGGESAFTNEKYIPGLLMSGSFGAGMGYLVAKIDYAISRWQQKN